MSETLPSPDRNQPVRAFSQPLVWMVVGIPAATVVAGLTTLWIAAHGADTPIGSDYVKEGLSVAPDTRREDSARKLGIAGSLSMHTTPEHVLEVELSLLPTATKVTPRWIRLLHPSDPNNDLTLHMQADDEHHWHARQPVTWAPGTRWHIALEGEGWRLPMAGLQAVESLNVQHFDARQPNTVQSPHP